MRNGNPRFLVNQKDATELLGKVIADIVPSGVPKDGDFTIKFTDGSKLDVFADWNAVAEKPEVGVHLNLATKEENGDEK